MEVSRREFLERSGKYILLFGAATKAWDFILAGTPETAPGYDVTRHWWAFYIDIEKCIGCGNCVRACKAENGLLREPFYFRTWVERYHIPPPDLANLRADRLPVVDSPNGGYDGFPERFRDGDDEPRLPRRKGRRRAGFRGRGPQDLPELPRTHGRKLNDLELARKVSWEGVTCDYCHSIRDVAAAGSNPNAVVQFGNVKSGPSRDSVSPAHGTAFSSVHTSALLCAVCHEYKNALGFPVVTTYSEWKESPSGKGDVECQQCHMELVKGAVVEPRVKRESSHLVNLHAMPGSHSVSQLNRALTAKLTASRNGETVDVVVKIKNEGAGHFLPTGSPMRQLILEVRLTVGGETTGGGRRTYTRALADADGAVIQKEYVAFLKAAKVVSDTRLAPDETRSETFSFKMPSATPGRVDATFYYFHPATTGPANSDRIKFLELSKSLPQPESRTGR